MPLKNSLNLPHDVDEINALSPVQPLMPGPDGTGYGSAPYFCRHLSSLNRIGFRKDFRHSVKDPDIHRSSDFAASGRT